MAYLNTNKLEYQFTIKHNRPVVVDGPKCERERECQSQPMVCSMEKRTKRTNVSDVYEFECFWMPFPNYHPHWKKMKQKKKQNKRSKWARLFPLAIRSTKRSVLSLRANIVIVSIFLFACTHTHTHTHTHIQKCWPNTHSSAQRNQRLLTNLKCLWVMRL